MQRNAYYKACDEYNANRSLKVRKNRDETFLKIGLEEHPRQQRPESMLPSFVEQQRRTVSTTKKLKQPKMKRNFDFTTRKRSPADEKILVQEHQIERNKSQVNPRVFKPIERTKKMEIKAVLDKVALIQSQI